MHLYNYLNFITPVFVMCLFPNISFIYMKMSNDLQILRTILKKKKGKKKNEQCF